jgi:hypothetical protein
MEGRAGDGAKRGCTRKRKRGDNISDLVDSSDDVSVDGTLKLRSSPQIG